MYDWIMYPFSTNAVEVDVTCQKEPWEERYHKESGISIVVATKISGKTKNAFFISKYMVSNI